MNPKDCLAWYSKGFALYHLDQYDEAIDWFNLVFRLINFSYDHSIQLSKTNNEFKNSKDFFVLNCLCKYSEARDLWIYVLRFK